MIIASFLMAASLGFAAQATPAQAAAGQQTVPRTSAAQAALNEELWNAARAGDVAAVTRALERGAEINSGNRYKATALFFAADKGHLEVVKLLLDKGADINATDTFYKMRAIDMAMSNDHEAVALALIERGSKGAAGMLQEGVRAGNMKLVQAALASADLGADDARAALAAARRGKSAEITAAIEKKVASLPADATAVTVDAATLQSYAGSYRNESSGATFTVALKGGELFITPPGGQPLPMIATATTAFKLPDAPGVAVAFAGRGGLIERMTVTQGGGASQSYERAAATPAPGTPAPGTPAPGTPAPGTPAAPLAPSPRTAPKPWPSFRGNNASGNGDGQGAATEWDAPSGKNIKWKTPIPGFTTASPIVWGNSVFVVSALSSAGDKTFRTGLYGDVKPVEDLSEHTWKIYALDKATGRILWERTAYTGVPKVKRHTKSTQANSTPVTDGTHVVALFGSVGVLAAWDMSGKQLWKTDIGVLDSGWFFDPTYQWGHSSSPIIHDGKVIVQADVQKGSFIAAFDVKTGKQLWRTERDEISSWGTPAIFTGPAGAQIVTNAPTIRGYDPATGKELWKLGPNSEVTVGSPVVGDGLIYITGGYPPVRPIYAVKPGASGDITMPKDKTSTEAVAWSNTNGTYIPTPLYYDGILYTCNNDGVLTAYDAKTGERLYRARVGGGGSFAASPVAADGKLYFANEDGDVIVARAGRTYQELAKNSMKEVIMSTPAISDGFVIVRTLNHVYGIGQ
jgi:outer membrane protein assembly factor BamB